MELDKTGLNDRAFEAFARTSDREYFYLCNMQTDVSRWSRNAVERFGLPGEYLHAAGAVWEQHIHPDDRPLYVADIEAVFAGRKLRHDLLYRARDRHGDYVTCSCRGVVLKGEGGEPDLFAGMITNHGIVESIDPVTGLYNGYEFLRALRASMRLRRRQLVLLVGVNEFGNVNQIHGYPFGNRLLRAFGERLADEVRGRGMAYRMDGTKFALVVPEADEAQAAELYARVQEIARADLSVDGAFVPLGVSGGAVVVRNFSGDEHAIRSCVVCAVAQSKRVRHGELVFFDNEDEGDSRRNLQLLDAVRTSVARGFAGFSLRYQPIVDARDGSLVGAEALLRWSGEPYGEVLPGRFVPWLEQDPCFYDLGNWIMGRALEDGVRMVRRHPGLRLNVNVSHTQIGRTGFRDAVVGALGRTGFPPENLCIELTERCRAIDRDTLMAEMAFFRARGIKVALDDFGTGAASLNLVRNLPIDLLKIDRSFVSNFRESVADQAIVDAVVSFAGRLGIEVCIEGVEDAGIVEFIAGLPVASHQGFHYARPLDLEHLLAFGD